MTTPVQQPITANNLGQAVALNMGWSGAGQGEGGHKDWVAGLDDLQRREYNQANTVNSMPALVEPLHEWERAGLTGQAGGVDTSGMESILANQQQRLGTSIDRAGGLVDQSGRLIEQGTASVSPDEVSQMQNPYASALKSKLSTSAEKIRAQALASQGLRGGRSFGDTSTGIQSGMIDQGQLQGEADIDYNTWQDALGQINTERNRYLTGSQGYGRDAGTILRGGELDLQGGRTAFGQEQEINRTGRQNLSDQINAGKYVRSYNQGVNDLIGQDVAAGQADELQRLIQVMDLMKGYQSNTSSGQTGGMANPMQQWGGAAQALSGSGLFSDAGGSDSSVPFFLRR